jgi:hypothetical protein
MTDSALRRSIDIDAGMLLVLHPAEKTNTMVDKSTTGRAHMGKWGESLRIDFCSLGPGVVAETMVGFEVGDRIRGMVSTFGPNDGVSGRAT